MDTISPSHGEQSEREARRQLEGSERIALLPSAEFLGVTVGTDPEEPVIVFIGWRVNLVERPYPGTAIWRAALDSFLRAPQSKDPAQPLVREAAQSSLHRFPSLERWLWWSDHERPAPEGPRAVVPSALWVGPAWNP